MGDRPQAPDQYVMTEMDIKLCDCVLGMSSLAPSTVDVVVTSPPYNLGTKYKTYSDDKAVADYLRWTSTWASEVLRVLKTNGSFFLNMGGSPKHPLLPYEVVIALKGIFTLQNTLHWIKSISTKLKDGNTLSLGHFKPINSGRFVTNCHEFIFHFTKTGRVPIDRLSVGVPYADKSNLKRWKHSERKDIRCRGNTWFVPYATIQNKDKDRPHPATFPKDLPAMCFKLHGNCANSVGLDPFLGIGNSALAAIEVGMARFIGFDTDHFYIDQTLKRISSHQQIYGNTSKSSSHT